MLGQHRHELLRNCTGISHGLAEHLLYMPVLHTVLLVVQEVENR